MNKFVSAILLSLALGLLPWGAGNANAADFAVPHTFQGGGVVSADELNERLDNLEQLQKNVVAADMVGTWSCPMTMLASNYSSASYTDWTLSASGLIRSSAYTITNTLSGSTLVSTTACPTTTPTTCTNSTITYQTETFNGVLYLNSSATTAYKKYSNTRMTIAGGAVCDKQNLPPLKPSGLAASASGTSITLTWTDNSTDETSFDIVRKDSASGTYAVVGNVTANTVTYTNTSVTTGTHWYRVIAKNANGSSLGSNVVKVTN